MDFHLHQACADYSSICTLPLSCGFHLQQVYSFYLCSWSALRPRRPLYRVDSTCLGFVVVLLWSHCVSHRWPRHILGPNSLRAPFFLPVSGFLPGSSAVVKIHPVEIFLQGVFLCFPFFSAFMAPSNGGDIWHGSANHPTPRMLSWP